MTIHISHPLHGQLMVTSHDLPMFRAAGWQEFVSATPAVEVVADPEAVKPSTRRKARGKPDHDDIV